MWPLLKQFTRKIKDVLSKGNDDEIHTNIYYNILGYHNFFCTKQAKDSNTICSMSHVDLPFLVSK